MVGTRTDLPGQGLDGLQRGEAAALEVQGFRLDAAPGKGADARPLVGVGLGGGAGGVLASTFAFGGSRGGGATKGFLGVFFGEVGFLQDAFHPGFNLLVPCVEELGPGGVHHGIAPAVEGTFPCVCGAGHATAHEVGGHVEGWLIRPGEALHGVVVVLAEGLLFGWGEVAKSGDVGNALEEVIDGLFDSGGEDGHDGGEGLG